MVQTLPDVEQARSETEQRSHCNNLTMSVWRAEAAEWHRDCVWRVRYTNELTNRACAQELK